VNSFPELLRLLLLLVHDPPHGNSVGTGRLQLLQLVIVMDFRKREFMLSLRNNNSLSMPLGHLSACYRLRQKCDYSVSPTRGEELVR
jgi:hypothetical protein